MWGWGWNIVTIGTDLADKRMEGGQLHPWRCASVRLCADLHRNASHPGSWHGGESGVVLLEEAMKRRCPG